MNPRIKKFSESERGVQLREELVRMSDSDQFNTATSYSTHDPNGMTFVEKHMKYMSQYPTMNFDQYISNLKLKSKNSK